MSTREDTLKEKYLKKSGRLCPVCGFNDFDEGLLSAGSRIITQAVGCNTCCSTWKEVYTVTNLEALTIVPEFLVDDIVTVRGHEGYFTVAAVKGAETVKVWQGKDCALLTVHTAELSHHNP